jgi:hypothetical protein
VIDRRRSHGVENERNSRLAQGPQGDDVDGVVGRRVDEHREGGNLPSSDVTIAGLASACRTRHMVALHDSGQRIQKSP